MLPDIYYFNPTCEPAIANGSPYYTAPARLRKFEADLGYLPVWLGEENDQVLVQGTVDKEFNLRLKNLGFKLSEPLPLKQALADDEWINQPKGRLFPWGWSPAVYRLFNQIFPSFRNDFQRSAVATWQGSHKKLYSRLTSVGLLKAMIEQTKGDWMPRLSDLPVVCTTHGQIYHEVDQCKKAVVKTPWSSSGRGLLLFPNGDSRKKNDELLSGMLNQQGFVTVEPWQDKVMDFSYQFFSLSGKIGYKGRTMFETDQKGRYIRNSLTDSPETDVEVSRFIEEHNSEVVSLLLTALSQSGYATLYEGWIGVDALIYRTEEGLLKFHPMVEINGRFTMGAIALKLRDYLAPGSQGFMQIIYSKTRNFQDFCQRQEAEKPLRMVDNKIVEGFLPLTPPSPLHHFGAYVEVIPALRCF